jgi:hypothetical protein
VISRELVWQLHSLHAVTSEQKERNLNERHSALVSLDINHRADSHGEQLVTGIAELQELKGFLAKYYTLFRDPGYGTVVLVIIGFTLVNLIVYGASGRRQLAAAGSELLCLASDSAKYTTSLRQLLTPRTSREQ